MSVPPKKRPRRKKTDILLAAIDATAPNHTRFATDVLGVSVRVLRLWLATGSCTQPTLRLAWLLARHPKLADEIAREFGPRAAKRRLGPAKRAASRKARK
jgi:hypothetical protein